MVIFAGRKENTSNRKLEEELQIWFQLSSLFPPHLLGFFVVFDCQGKAAFIVSVQTCLYQGQDLLRYFIWVEYLGNYGRERVEGDAATIKG